ncbi:MAG: hypothetical protein O4753_13740 [Trichodesmium sp. St7_bin2_1]|jgi:hypothetical protein|nr:hypothetical protein [Trichodesmium sp. St7_bin2_1]MDE5117826.1 hypothetical protein [Trichodesmium sp. St2_bin2_1]
MGACFSVSTLTNIANPEINVKGYEKKTFPALFGYIQTLSPDGFNLLLDILLA